MPDSTILELRVGPIAHGGHCVARYEGRVIFVRHAIPGELVRVRVTEQDPTAKFWRADVCEVLESSEHRVEHFWDPANALKHAEPVGGAEFGHIALAWQRELKAQIVREQFQRLAGMEAAAAGFTQVLAAPQESDGLHWRTRMAYTVDAHGRLAMSAHRSHTLTALSSMPLAHRAIEAARLYELNFRGISRVEVAVSSTDESLLVLLAEAERGAAARVAAALPKALNIAAFSQGSGAAADGQGQLTRLRGRTWLSETVGEHNYRITGEGFWQIHRQAARVLTERVLDLCDPQPGQVIADLYAGAGLFSVPLAQRVGQSGMVFSVEGAPGTHRDAKKNLRQLPHARVIQGRVERVLKQVSTSGLDTVVLDPPRVGIEKSVAAELAASGAAKICYVSCDPASFARDVARLTSRGYELRHVEVHDLYPHTHHLESVGFFVRR